MATDVGMSVSDFTDNPLADFGRTVSWENSTKATDPITGDESLSYAEAANKTVVFLKRSKTYEQSPEGLVELGDAYCMSAVADGFAKDDRLTIDSQKYLIRRVIRRYTNEGTAMFDFCVLFKTDDS